ncbi:MAG TPA: hypothetical protein VMH86_09705 [Rhizomicrobium sp.]|nr:hypothetical protein [Rhizomicrobium sp.]
MRAVGLVFCVAALAIVASRALAYPDGSEALESRLLARMGPETRAWIQKEGDKLASAHVFSGETARSAAYQYGASGPGLDALAFLVLMRAERDADASVRGVAVNDMSAAESRQDERQSQMRNGQITYAQQAQKSGSMQVVEEANAKPSVSLLPNPSGQPTQPFTLRTGVPTSGSPPPPGIALQDAMDRESQFDDLVADAMKPLTPAAEAAVPAMP